MEKMCFALITFCIIAQNCVNRFCAANFCAITQPPSTVYDTFTKLYGFIGARCLLPKTPTRRRRSRNSLKKCVHTLKMKKEEKEEEEEGEKVVQWNFSNT